jgi:hypothetical protein
MTKGKFNKRRKFPHWPRKAKVLIPDESGCSEGKKMTKQSSYNFKESIPGKQCLK